MKQLSTPDAENKRAVKAETKGYLYSMSQYDVLLISIALVLSAGGLLHIGKGTPAGVARHALVYEKGKLIEKIDIKKDNVINLSLVKGKIDVEVRGGRIRVSNPSEQKKHAKGLQFDSPPYMP